ncbi:MAG TPA: hypothetical protein VEA35_15125 [Ramlibacter sp.]|nr:hypothetical protein [Ramlibacter sp.]
MALGQTPPDQEHWRKYERVVPRSEIAIGALLVGICFAVWAYALWLDPPAPPFSGRGRLIKIWMHGALGPNAFPVFVALAALASFFVAWSAWTTRHAKPKTGT